MSTFISLARLNRAKIFVFCFFLALANKQVLAGSCCGMHIRHHLLASLQLYIQDDITEKPHY